MITYREIALKSYGNKCEFAGCKWDETTCDVHHINYKLQHRVEKTLRKAVKLNKSKKFISHILNYAYKNGFSIYDFEEQQLSKDDSVSNLAVLCPNHHRLVHEKDLAKEILKYIPNRL